MKKSTFGFLIISLLLLSCGKQEVLNQNGSKIKLLGSPLNESCSQIYPASDGGILMFSNGQNPADSSQEFIMTKLTEDGTKVWEKILFTGNFSVSLNHLTDGSFLLLNDISTQTTNQASLLHIDQSGNILFNTPFLDTATFYVALSVPMQGDTGSFFLTQFYAWQGAGNIYAKVIPFDQNGNCLKADILQIEPAISGAIFTYGIYRAVAPKTFYFYGLIYPPPVNFYYNANLFVAMIKYTGNKIAVKKTVILDKSNVNDINTDIKQVTLADNSILMCCTQSTPGHYYKVHLTKVDSTLTKTWETDVRMGIWNTYVNSLTISKDGSFLLCGQCNTVDKELNQPFALKMDPNGNILWSKIYTMPKNAYINSGYERPDGNLVFGGTTNSFAKGLNMNDIFLFNTDNTGNLK
jgi:hypothetical protein